MLSYREQYGGFQRETGWSEMLSYETHLLIFQIRFPKNDYFLICVNFQKILVL